MFLFIDPGKLFTNNDPRYDKLFKSLPWLGVEILNLCLKFIKYRNIFVL